MNYGHMLGTSAFKIICALITNIKKKSHRLPIYKLPYRVIEVSHITHVPIIVFIDRIKCPQSSIVALSSDDRINA